VLLLFLFKQGEIKMNELLVKDDIESMIYEINGKNIILDSDLAKLFGMETKVLNQNVKRNINIFSKRDNFEISLDEYKTLSRSQIVTLDTTNVTRGQNVKYAHKAFTRDGVATLSSIMRNKKIKNIVDEILYTFDKLESNNSLIIKGRNIQEVIYEINGIQVMLDSDLAYLYECKNGTKEINQAVKNNPDKFPERFSWVLNDEEKNYLRSKILTTNYTNMSRSNPRVFTEQGVVMLATILHTNVAINTSIKIIDAFVAMKKYISYVSLPRNSLTNLVLEDHIRIEKLEEAFDKFREKELTTSVYFEGQIFDAYSKILQIFSSAKEELIIIDNYADIKLLDIIKNLNINVILITTKEHLKENDIEKYNGQYHNLKVIYNNTFHDRFFIIDKKIVYICGSSINRIGYKSFAITKISDDITNNTIINKTYEIVISQ